MNEISSIPTPGAVLQLPFVVGSLSAILCAIGIWVFFSANNSVTTFSRINTVNGSNLSRRIYKRYREIFTCLIVGSVVTLVVLYWSSSLIISLPFTFFALIITWTFLQNRSKRAAGHLLEVWPEVTDHLISGLHSGMSLSEALVGLSTRGPLLVRPYFLIFQQELLRTGDFSRATEELRDRFSSHGSDQIFEAILLAKSLGGSELLQIFRTLGDFLRQDLAVRKEIEIKHGWIKNSAHLSSAAPWLLLLLLSSQPATARAFNQPSGALILLAGLILTGIAYFWMGRLGQMPKSARVFGSNS